MSEKMQTEEISFSLYTTNLGGLAQKKGDGFVFVVPPRGDLFHIGDPVPKSWELAFVVGLRPKADRRRILR